MLECYLIHQQSWPNPTTCDVLRVKQSSGYRIDASSQDLILLYYLRMHQYVIANDQLLRGIKLGVPCSCRRQSSRYQLYIGRYVVLVLEVRRPSIYAWVAVWITDKDHVLLLLLHIASIDQTFAAISSCLLFVFGHWLLPWVHAPTLLLKLDLLLLLPSKEVSWVVVQVSAYVCNIQLHHLHYLLIVATNPYLAIISVLQSVDSVSLMLRVITWVSMRESRWQLLLLLSRGEMLILRAELILELVAWVLLA